jgi:uncharacterized damage-inducible protein DinB
MIRHFSHVIGAQQIWLTRIHGEDRPELQPWPDLQPDTWPRALHELHDGWLGLLETLGDELNRKIDYRNTKGQSFSTLRQQGLTPPSTDFILYLREKPA